MHVQTHQPSKQPFLPKRASAHHPAQPVQVTNIIARQPLQAKLKVGAPNDRFEQEADRVADRVIRMPDPAAATSGMDPTPHSAMSIQRKCAGCEDETLQRKPDGSHRDTPSSGLDSVASTLRQGGRPLDAGTRRYFEPRFGADFSNVRIHTDTQAAESARSVNALAYTVGRDVVFNSGQYAPHRDSGKRLLAHELTHVMQQGGGSENNAGEKSGHLPISLQKENSSLQPMIIQRDFAVEPTAPDAVGRELTPAQLRNAITWNQAAFSDADEISLLRDVLGISAEPAVIDEDFVRVLVQYQANYGLTQDGLLGAGTAERLANELRAEATSLGAEADVGSPATEMALNPAQRRMRLRSRVVGRLGRMLHQGFIGPRENPTGVVTTRSGFTNPGRADLTNSIGINYTGSNADNSRWLQFAFRQMSAIDPATGRRVYRAGTTSTSAGIGRPYSDGTTFRWAVDTAPASGSMYYEAGFTAERVAGAHTETFDQPNRWNFQAESYAASFATRPSRVRMINGFDAYLVVNNNTVIYHVRWNIYFNFDTSASPIPDVAGTYEVLTAGAVSRLPADRKTVLDAGFPTNTVP